MMGSDPLYIHVSLRSQFCAHLPRIAIMGDFSLQKPKVGENSPIVMILSALFVQSNNYAKKLNGVIRFHTFYVVQ